MKPRLNAVLILVAAVFISSCTAFWQAGSSQNMRQGVSGSLVDYLYPKGEAPPPRTDDIPQLQLPLRVGLSFVPSANNYQVGISGMKKAELLEQVRASFTDKKYIESIEVIPDSYLRSASGFDGLQQVARVYGVDVMALISYDQISITDDNKASLLYWTIVGAYLIEGSENEVQTFVDTAVFDVRSRKLMVRAPGADKREARSTAVASNEAIREASDASFAAAIDKMSANLAVELTAFEQKLKDRPDIADVSWRSDEDRATAGAMDITVLLWLCAVVGLRRAHSYKADKAR